MSQRDDVREYIHQRWSVGTTFTLTELYDFEVEFSTHYPANNHVRNKLRQLIQNLRDEGTVRFVDDTGTYERLT